MIASKVRRCVALPLGLNIKSRASPVQRCLCVCVCRCPVQRVSRAMHTVLRDSQAMHSTVHRTRTAGRVERYTQDMVSRWSARAGPWFLCIAPKQQHPTLRSLPRSGGAAVKCACATARPSSGQDATQRVGPEEHGHNCRGSARKKRDADLEVLEWNTPNSWIALLTFTRRGQRLDSGTAQSCCYHFVGNGGSILFQDNAAHFAL